MSPIPPTTPARQGRPRSNPTLAPVEVKMKLLGPGVIAATTAKSKKLITWLAVIAEIPPHFGTLEVCLYDEEA
jgi:hypothetical protein